MKDISIALGGGGIRGIAHIGVLRKLEQHGYRIKAIAGTSAGGLVGAVYAAGYNADKIEKLINSVNQRHLVSISLNSSPALLNLQGLSKMMSGVLGEMNFNTLHIPFACTAVDIESAQEIIIHQGRVIEAVLATSAFPGVFPPVKLDKFTLVDGGVLDPVPVDLARWLAPTLPVIAVCLSPEPNQWGHLPAFTVPSTIPIPNVLLEQVSKLKLAQAFQIFYRSMDVISRSMAELRLQIDKPDVILRPEVDQFGLLDEVDPQVLIQAGEQAVENNLAEIRRKLSWKNRLFRGFEKQSPPGVPITAISETTD